MTRGPAFTCDDLIDCYRAGVFPMGEARDDSRVYLVDPEARGVLPLDGFHLSRRLGRTVRRSALEVRVDTAFEEVVASCAESRAGRRETWINDPIRRLYGELAERGLAHSVECWSGDDLVGGLYGVALGGAFFGESMFSRVTDASKIALVHLVGRLAAGGYRLLDTQFLTDHLASFGALEVTRARYRRMLVGALATAADFYALAPGPEAALQAISQTS